ncbi:ribulose-phosphate 3-epimerase [Carnobacterium pleistocenium]|uniref:ribulose-phosphate 3-epimerase n=1 Tax=Carnobacterium pleistocenium TaxID=181073 RepID=UPI0005589212|nr:ribulose-phosphate 3-epimerase [Carnobacterium pleistocenium]
MTYMAASLMCGDQLHIGDELDKLEKANCDLLHLDVMDGIYVNNLALGPEWIDAVKKTTTIPIDIHLATIDPIKYIDMFAPLQPEFLSFHVEEARNVAETIAKIKSYGIKPSIALNPETPLSAIMPFLDDVEMVLMMTVNPGFSGQKFNKKVLKKIEELSELLLGQAHRPLIEVDGNIKSETIEWMNHAQPDIFVLGTSALFHENDNESYGTRMSKLRQQIERYKA